MNVNSANSVPRFGLIGKDGRKYGEFNTAEAAGLYAKSMWPDQEQDPDRTGKGWDIQTICSL